MAPAEPPYGPEPGPHVCQLDGLESTMAPGYASGYSQYIPARRTPILRVANPPSRSDERRLVAPFEFNVFSNFLAFSKSSCIGGGADVAYRLRDDLQVAVTVHGCNLFGMDKNVTGDALVYQAGPRWTPFPRARWSPYVNLQVGGMKITQEQFYPDKQAGRSSLQGP